MRLVRFAAFIASFAILLGGMTAAGMAAEICGGTTLTSKSLLAKLSSPHSVGNTCAGAITVTANGIKVASPSCCGNSICNCCVDKKGQSCKCGTSGCLASVCNGGQGGTVSKNAPCCVSNGTNGTPNNGACYCDTNGSVGTGSFCPSSG
jgi:hypothetical protein